MIAEAWMRIHVNPQKSKTLNQTVRGKREKIARREKGKGESMYTNIWDRRSTAPAVHQILMQAPPGVNTDC